MQKDIQPNGVVPVHGACRVRVRYCECDPMRVAHHASYVPWLEEARTELLRMGGVSYADMEQAGVFLAVIALEAQYKGPALYDDLVEVGVRVTGATRVKIHHSYEVRVVERAGAPVEHLERMRAAGSDLLVVARTTLACLDTEGRPRALPEWLSVS